MKGATIEANGTAMDAVNGIKETPGPLTQGLFSLIRPAFRLYAVPGNPSEVHQKWTTEASQLRAADFPCRD
jgi:hypothetical protein